VGISCAKDLIPSEFSGDELADDVSVGEANDEPVFWGVVLVSGLSDELLASL
jgi:hypothetical protein